MNFKLFRKNKKGDKVEDNNIEEQECLDVYNIKDLYLAMTGLVTRDNEKSNFYWYNKDKKEGELIVCQVIASNKVRNVLNKREYYIFTRMNGYFQDYNRTYMVDVLKPFESELDDQYKTRETITREEIIEYLYPNSKKEEIVVKDVILNKISETDDKINKSSLDDEIKEKLKNKLVEIANNYVHTLKDMSNPNSTAISLNAKKESLLNLRQEVARELVEIEMMLPPEKIDILTDELEVLEKKILKRG